MTMPMAAAVGAGFRFERALDGVDLTSQALQQIGQYRIGFQPQPVDIDLQRDVSIAQVIGGTQQGQGIGCADFQHRLRGGDNTETQTIGAAQKLARWQRAAARQDDGEFATVRQAQALPTAPTRLVIEWQRRRTGVVVRCGFDGVQMDQGVGRRAQNRKYRCAIGSSRAGSHHRASPSARTT